jgi:hypothetical protein
MCQEEKMRQLVSSFSVDIGQEKMSWQLDGSAMSLAVPGLAQAIFDKGANAIVVITRVSGKESVAILSPDGKIKHDLEPPLNYVLSHLVEHPEHGLCVVCNGNQSVNGWYDWYFKVDSRRGILSKVTPSY